MHRQLHPIALYLMSLAATVAAYGAYQKFAVPVIEGPPNIVVRRTPTVTQNFQQPSLNTDSFATLFSPQDWELGSCKTLVTDHGKILFQDYQPQDEGYVDVFPFTMILEEPEDKGPPTVLRCLDGAKLKFERPLGQNSSGGGSTKIERATLNGEVIIYRPPSTSANTDSMEIRTRDVQIEHQRVFTLADVDFKFGKNEGSGKNLIVDFARQAPNNPLGADFSQVNGISRVELSFLKYMRLEMSPSSSSSSQPNGTQLMSQNRAPLEVTCKGAFTFDLDDRRATFEDDVLVKQLDASGDNLKCESLLLDFVETASDNVEEVGDLNRSMNLNAITAVGNPATLTARSRNAIVKGKSLFYDLEANRVIAENENGSVSVSDAEFNFVARKIDYLLSKDRRLGTLNSTGPGKMVRNASPGRDAFSASWQKSLNIAHEDEKRIVILDGEAVVAVDTETQIDSDQLRLWMLEKEVEQFNANTGERTSKIVYEPSKLVTNGNVNFRSRQLRGTSRQLSVYWPGGESPAKRSVEQPQRMSTRRPVYQETPQTRLTNVQSRMYDTQVAPASYNQPLMKPAFQRQDTKGREFKFDADKVDVYLMESTRGSTLRKLFAEGNVSVRETNKRSEGFAALKINGERLELEPQGTTQQAELYQMQVSARNGVNAVVSAEGMNLKGKTIHLNQSENKVWVEGSGDIRLSPSKNPNLEQQPDDLHVNWMGGMIFNGHKIYFEDQVRMKANQKTKPGSKESTIISTLSKALSVKLARPVNFQNLSGATQATGRIDSRQDSGQASVEIEEIILVDRLSNGQHAFAQAAFSGKQTTQSPVVIENKSVNGQGIVVEQQQIVVPKATVNTVSGAITARGPGTLIQHRRGGGSIFPSGLAGQSPQRPRPKRTELNAIQVNFDGTLLANSNSREMQIAGNVRTLYAPVNSLQQAFNPDKTFRIPEGGVKLTCQQIQMAQWQSREDTEATSELIATGNTHIWGDLFEATSDQVRYKQSTDMLTIVGTPRAPAHLWYQRAKNAQKEELVADKVLYRLSDQRTEIQNVKNATTHLEGNLFGGSKK